MVNTRLLVKHGKYVFLQNKGLAMGVGCSPDIANLYAANYEQEFPANESVIFFKRYMDDILVILKVQDGVEPMEILDTLAYPGLRLKWSTSISSVVFLDMRIWLNHRTGRVEFCPYNKPLNHYERIPWDSAHPVWMKRGSFAGELSRFASISSERKYYVAAVRQLQQTYLSRGYPDRVINKWTKDKYDKYWASTIAVKHEDMIPLILKTYINPVWEGISMEEVHAAMRRAWFSDPESDVEDPFGLQSTILLSRRKPFWLSLDTMMRTWNQVSWELFRLTPEYCKEEAWTYEIKE